MMLTFVQATNEDILSIQVQSHQAGPKMACLIQEKFLHGLVTLTDQAISVREDEACIGAYGYTELWTGVIHLWALFSERLIENYPIALMRRARYDLERAEKRSEAIRVETTVTAKHAAGVEFLKWLGFQPEGLLRRYSPDGEDLWLFSKVRDAENTRWV